jgi:hypothetical protein
MQSSKQFCIVNQIKSLTVLRLPIELCAVWQSASERAPASQNTTFI